MEPVFDAEDLNNVGENLENQDQKEEVKHTNYAVIEVLHNEHHDVVTKLPHSDFFIEQIYFLSSSSASVFGKRSEKVKK